MKKLLLIQPPTHPESLVFGYMNPYALEILAAGIIESFSNVDVEIIDLRVEKGSNGCGIYGGQTHLPFHQ